ncbi:MAG: hypothetical protein HY905_21920 [Deltaproteobacteria bacterium]|nr:hypothetical protein [Deltaproteobacteria bacterium]
MVRSSIAATIIWTSLATLASWGCDDGGGGAADAEAGGDADVEPDTGDVEEEGTEATEATEATEDGAGGACRRNSVLMSERQECVRDDQCPCGKNCELGLCVFECEADVDCGDGRRCDDFGRCRAADDLAPVLPVDATPQPVLELSDRTIEFRSPGTERVVRITAAQRPAGRVRVAASAGVEVKCDPDGAFTTECTWDGIEVGPDDEARILVVRWIGPAAVEEDLAGTVRIWTGALRLSVGVRIVAPDLAVRSLDDGVGIYRGHASPAGAWLASNPRTDAVPAEVSDMRVPVTMKVYPASSGEHVVALSDELHAVFPDSPTVGRLYQSGGTWHLEVLRRLLVGPSPAADDSPEVTVRFGSADLAWGRGSIAGDVDATFEGATTDAHAPVLRWHLAVTWEEELAGGDTAPAVPAAYGRRSLADAANRSFRVETGARGDLPAAIGATPAEQAGAALCTCCDSTATVERLTDDVLVLSSGLASPVGDLACVNPGDPQLTYPFLGETSFQTHAVVQECLDDLEIMDSGTAGLGEDTGCADAPRAVLAMSLGLQRDRERAVSASGTADPSASSIGHRMVQQWAALHAFVVREADAVQALNDILPPGDRLAQSFTALEALQRGVAGWDLLFHPRIAAALPLLPAAVLNAPDYRPRVFPSGSYPDVDGNEQPVGLSASLLHSLVEELGPLGGLVYRSSTGDVDYAQVEPLLTDYLRRGFVLFALARGLYFTARGPGAVDWQEEWDLAQVAWGTAVDALLRAVKDHDAGRNTLGIEDFDLPLYRVGDDVSAGDRFSALSDYLLGYGVSDTAVAPALVNRAQDSLDAAHDMWFALNERNFQAAMLGDDHGRRIEGINRKYGEEIISLCGNPDWDSATVLAMWNDIDPNTCYLREACKPTTEDRKARVNAADLGYLLCYVGKVRERYADASTGSDDVDARADDVYGDLYVDAGAFPLRIAAVNDTEVQFEDTTASVSYVLPWSAFDEAGAIEEDELDAEYVEEVRTTCQAAREESTNQRNEGEVILPTGCELADDCPVDYVCRAGTCEADTGRSGTDPECFMGSLGSLAIGVQATAREVDVANSEMNDLTEQYNISAGNCKFMLDTYDKIEAATTKHNNQIEKYLKVKLAFQVLSNVAGAAKDIGSMGLDDCILGGGVGIAGAIVEAAANSVVDGMDYAIETADREYEEDMAEFEHDIEYNSCMSEAEQIRVQIDTGVLRAQAAALNLGQSMVEFGNLKNELRALCREGHAALLNESGRRVDPLSLDFWMAEAIETFRSHMRQARRATYLAMLAVEYEFQFSSAEGDRILAAQSPGELEASLDALRAVALTGTVGGALPANLFAAVSLSDHVLDVADQSAMPVGWAAMTPAQRFHIWLTDPSNSVYDDEGNYLGQEVDFAVWPNSEATGIPILAGTDCAERVWSVNASLIGTDSHVGAGTFSRVVLRKRNTFHSQWCGGTHDTDYQDASTRPSVNLFLDPYGFEESNTPYTPQPDRISGDETRAFSNARISAYFNVGRAELEDESYFNGDSQELAGRGFYGDYALFFPAETLSDSGGDGLVLEHVDDVLLRFDYVSVASGGK